MATKIKVTISKTGEVKTTVEGVPGAKCEGVLDRLQDALGNTVEEGHTPEFYLEETENVVVVPW